tara:strand:- start:1056 stop:1364 length:309 start_codon:yes stop_codon:yes gene_type:complete
MNNIPELPFEIISKILNIRMESKKSDRIEAEILEQTENNKIKFCLVMNQLDFLIDDLSISIQTQLDCDPDFEEELNNLTTSELILDQLDFFNSCYYDLTEDY